MVVAGKSSFSQSISAVADREKILIGEQIKLLLKTDNVNGITNWFAFPDTVNHMEVVERSKIDTIEIAGTQNYQQTITITSFDSGQWQIPALEISAASKTFTTQPITIEVIPVDVSQLQEYHDIKEIVEVEQKSSTLIIIIIAAITLVSLALVYWFMQRKKPVTAKAPVIKGNLSPLEWAMQELDKLRSENLPSQNAVKQHYQKLTNIARQFFVLQLQHKSLHQTTDEWMLNLQPIPVRQDAKTSFLQLLRLADTVKFAKYLPPAEENERSIEVTRQMVEQVATWQNTIVNAPKKSS
jgi:hypothetical protein